MANPPEHHNLPPIPRRRVVEHRHLPTGMLLILECGDVVYRPKSAHSFNVRRVECYQCWWRLVPDEERRPRGFDPCGAPERYRPPKAAVPLPGQLPLLDGLAGLPVLLSNAEVWEKVLLTIIRAFPAGIAEGEVRSILTGMSPGATAIHAPEAFECALSALLERGAVERLENGRVRALYVPPTALRDMGVIT